MSWAAAGLATAVLAILLLRIPRRLIRRGQDRLAEAILARDPGPESYHLLTPAERFIGGFRRVPGVLGMNRSAVVFESRFEAPTVVPLAEIRKIVSGKVISTGRRLFRDEVLLIELDGGRRAEFQMPHASVYQWRQSLGRWAARQKSAGS
jgi:hypothetical protein